MFYVWLATALATRRPSPSPVASAASRLPRGAVIGIRRAGAGAVTGSQHASAVVGFSFSHASCMRFGRELRDTSRSLSHDRCCTQWRIYDWDKGGAEQRRFRTKAKN